MTEYSLVYRKTSVHFLILNHLQSAHGHLRDLDMLTSAIYGTKRFFGSRQPGLIAVKVCLGQLQLDHGAHYFT